MVHSTLPAGAKDLLPLDVAQKRWIESRVQKVFQAWGYQHIITPTLERLETLTAGGAVQPDTVIQIRGSGSEVLGLRPELTASIARAYAPRLGGAAKPPQRLYYNANVFRMLPASGYPAQQEYYQSGVELLGGSGILADGEILLLLADCLKQVNLHNWQIVLGDARLTGSLLNTFPSQYREKIRHCVANLDRIQLENLPISDQVRLRALQLLDLRGKPLQVLEKMRSLDWTADLVGEIDYLKSLIELWESVAVADSMILDLSLIQTFDYYTGIVFEVVCSTHVIAQGGRYDQLLGVYHPQGITYPSIGFCLNLENLQKVMLPTLPNQTQISHCLVVPTSRSAIQAAFAHAAILRSQPDSQVELELQLRSTDDVVAHARSRGIKQIAWVSDTGIKVEQLDSLDSPT